MFLKKIILFLLIGVISSTVQAKESPKSISFVTTNWQPFMGKSLPAKGLIAEIAIAAFNKVGYSVDRIAFRPWVRALRESERGKYHVLLGAYRSKERDKIYYASDSILTSRIAIVARKETNLTQITKAEELNPLKVGMVRGYEYPVEITQAKLNNVVYAKNDEKNLEHIFHNRVPIIIIDLDHFAYLAKPELHKITTILQPTLEHKDIHLMVSKKVKNAKKIIADFNKGLSELKKSGELDRIHQSYTNYLVRDDRQQKKDRG